MRRVLKGLAVTAAAASITSILAGCGTNGEQRRKEESIPYVRTSTAESTGSTRTVSYPGRIQPEKDVNLSFRVAGPIAAVHFREGQHVCKGDTLAEIEERDKAEAGRVIELADRGSAAQNDYDKARYGLEQMTALYNAHKNALNDTKMTAPFDGYVQQIHFEAGETVGAGMPVVTLISDNAPVVRVDIPATDFASIDNALRSWCTVDIYPDRTFRLDLIDITKKANLNQLFTARYALRPASDGTTPHPGTGTAVYIEFNSGEDASVSIPATALFESQGQSCVWVVDRDGRVERRSVTAEDIDRDGNARITSGLNAGETVVTAGVHSMKEGEQVRILPGASATNVGNLL